jgi:hypothetical protein
VFGFFLKANFKKTFFVPDLGREGGQPNKIHHKIDFGFPWI